ncbi:MAG: AbrB/MazE/SpoVT family DNA-binding domain-containing protein [Candidatus Micrarchaeota archaeon]
MKTKTHDFKGEIYAKIPPEIVKKLSIDAGDEIDFSAEGARIYISSGKPELSELDIALLKKLNAVLHKDRTSDKVNSMVSDEERARLASLLKKGALFTYLKEGKAFVGIDRKYFPYLSNDSAPSVAAKSGVVDPILAGLLSRGWLIAEPEEVSDIVYQIKKAGAENAVFGLRAFDKKYYIIVKDRLMQIEPKLVAGLSQEKSLSDLSRAVSEPEELCKCALEVLKEQGLVLETKRDYFRAV